MFAFCRAVAARESAANNPKPSLPGNSASTTMTKPKVPAPKKDLKKPLKGVVVKKKPKPAASSSVNSEAVTRKAENAKEDDDTLPDAKRRKVADS